MKLINVIIIVLITALLVFSYILADKIYQKMNNDGRPLSTSLLVREAKEAQPTAAEAPLTKIDLEVREALRNTERAHVLPPPSTIPAPTPPMQEPQAEKMNDLPKKKELRPVRDIKVIIYVTSWCPYCKKAKDYLNSQGVSFTEYDIERDSGAADEMARKTGGSRGVPVVDVEGIIIRGYGPDAISNALKQKQNS